MADLAMIIVFPQPDGSIEFDCQSCGNRVVVFAWTPRPPICLTCEFLDLYCAGWRDEPLIADRVIAKRQADGK